MTKYRASFRAWGGSFTDILKDLYDNVRSGKEDIVSVERIDASTIEVVTEFARVVKKETSRIPRREA